MSPGGHGGRFFGKEFQSSWDAWTMAAPKETAPIGRHRVNVEKRGRASGTAFCRALLLLLALTGLALCGRFQAGRLVYAVCWVGAFVALALAVRRFPGATRKRAVALLLVGGLGLRLLFVWAWPADSDTNRYIVEGALQASGGNPYLLAPGDPAFAGLLPQALHPVLAGVNHKELSAAYPPLAELYCRLVAAIAPTPTGMQVAAALADTGTCLAMAAWVLVTGAPTSLLLACVANPLSLAMAAGEGHLDAPMTFCLALAMLCFAGKRDGSGFFLLGAAGMVKYPALILIPFFLDRANARKAWTALLPLGLFGLFAPAGGHFFTSLRAFAGYSSHGGPVTALLRPLLGLHAPAVSLILGGGMLAVLWLVVQDRRRGPLAALTVVLACLPSLYPWYFLLMIPLFPARPGWACWWLLAGQGLVTAPTWMRAGGLGGEGVAMAAVWLPFLAMTIRGWYRPLLLVTAREFSPVNRLCVIIPTQNEADRLGTCLDSLAVARARGMVAAVIVADGGSDDATRAVADAHGATVVVSGGGRGGQIAAGLEVCPGDAVLIMHADARCHLEVPGRILQALQADGHRSGGAVGMTFGPCGPGRLGIAALNALRVRMTGISFGDQGQFFRRQALAAAGGFPAMALMEDVELALRLVAVGETVCLGGGLTVSDRRWVGQGFGRKVTRVLLLFTGYLAGRRLGIGDPSGRRQYRRYYGRPPHQTAM